VVVRDCSMIVNSVIVLLKTMIFTGGY